MLQWRRSQFILRRLGSFLKRQIYSCYSVGDIPSCVQKNAYRNLCLWNFFIGDVNPSWSNIQTLLFMVSCLIHDKDLYSRNSLKNNLSGVSMQKHLVGP